MVEPNLVTRVGALPRVGEPGSTLGGRVLPGYGFPATEGGAPIAGEAPLQPTSINPAFGAAAAGAPPDANPLAGDANAIANGGTLYRARCFGCHLAAGGSGPRIFRSPLSARRYFEIVDKGVPGTMPAFHGLLTPEQIWQIHAFTSAHDRLP
jgi:mono/diheme cytochrome c family protein